VPSTWPPLEILHLSDLHVRRGDPALLAAQKAALSRLDRQPDLVCVTGDLCEKVEDAPLVADLLRLVQPRLGTFVILGNHEYAAGAPRGGPRSEKLMARVFHALFGPGLSSGPCEGDAVATALADHGLCVLRNQGVRLRAGEISLWVAGVDDGWAGRADVAKALAGRQPGEGALVLIHEPELAFAAVEHGADLILAGHTHGGQVSLPIVGAPIWHRMDPRLRVPAGIQAIGKAQLHISAGTGQLVPLRFRCPPELVLLHCRP
jgi:predicted MPP superfamily phosphohydrolase